MADSCEPRVLQEDEVATWRMQFSTGREYTPQGQLIEVKIISWQLCPLEGRDIFKPGFIDRNRGICGTLQVAELIPAAVMGEYDSGRYEGLCTGAYEDLGFVGRV